jgi:hypothetical protein
VLESHIIRYADALPRLFPDFQELTILVLDNWMLAYDPPLLVSTENAFLTLTSWKISYMNDGSLEAYMALIYPITSNLFYQDQLTVEVSSSVVVDNVAYFLRAYVEGQGDSARMRVELDTPLSSGSGVRNISDYTIPGMADSYPLAEALYAIYLDEGEDALRAALDTLIMDFARLSTLPIDQIIAEIN